MDTAVIPSEAGIPFPPRPEAVPPELTKASSKYKLHAWMALGGLLLFGLIYAGLTAWFGYSA